MAATVGRQRCRQGEGSPFRGRARRCCADAGRCIYWPGCDRGVWGVSLIAPRQREKERGSFVGSAICPHAAIVFGNDAADDGQPHARTFEIGGAMQPLEYAEELVIIIHVEAYTVVFD